MEYFHSLSLWQWRQFRRIELDLTPRLVLLTGPNGCGKTTILNVLGRHFGWNIHFVSTPHLSSRKEKRFWSDVYEARADQEATEESHAVVGEIKYSDANTSQLRVPAEGDSSQYQLQYSSQPGLPGIHIPSHRPVTNHTVVDTIPVNPKTSQQQFLEFQQLLFQTYGSANARNPGTVLKQSLIALAVFGHGNEVVAPNEEYLRLFQGFQTVLSKLLPASLGFERLEIRAPDIVLKTATGTFSLDAMSGGISAIVGMAWQIHMYGASRGACTVIIDEPENHLHPSMQRQFLPALLDAFPQYKFIVSTHSPFVVGSSADGVVYALTFDSGNRVISTRLENADLAGSPNRILRDVLDVPTTLPIWVENRIIDLLSQLDNAPNRDEAVTRIHTSLREIGLDLPLADLMQEGRRQ